MKVKSVCLTAPERLELMERDLKAGAGEVIVKTFQTSICDADLRAFQGQHMPEDLPSFKWIGHEGGGTVVDVGDGVREFKPGDQVMCFGPNNAWSTHFKAHVNTLLPLPEGLPIEIGCLGEPTAVGMFGVFQSGVQLGDDVCVVGLNYQGLIAVEGLKKRGAKRVIAVDYSDVHLKMAKTRGADMLINTTTTAGAIEEIRETTSGRGVDVAFHSCGYWNSEAEAYFNLCCHIIRDEGILVSIPDMMSPIKAQLHRLHHHAIDVRFPAIMHHGPDFLRRWVPRVLRPAADGLIDAKGLITSEFSLSDFESAIRKYDSDPNQVKIVMRP